ncbi:MAG: hypothetical protein IJL66_02875 [Lachnospiraceae bacterium]|nr:hypothetical protein [Lachnospiraceae bacterium]
MNYFIREIINGDPTAGPKARNDASDILQESGWVPLTLDFTFVEKAAELDSRGFLRKLKDNLALRKEWRTQLRKIKAGDTVLAQFPVLRRPIALAWEFRAVQKRGGKVALLIHDLELLRYNRRSDVGFLKKLRIKLEESAVLKCADSIIAHNPKMIETLRGAGFADCRLISLDIFDYLIPAFSGAERKLEKNVAIAGTLKPHKCQYLLRLPDNVSFQLYGIGYEDQGMPQVTYHGAFPPEELPGVLEASFGLVWDGDSADSCTGVSGEYLRINNPHKASLYLASGLPVIIWKEAALSEFITENGCGLSVNSLKEIGGRITDLTEEEYQRMVANAARISEKLRGGEYLKKAVSQIN